MSSVSLEEANLKSVMTICDDINKFNPEECFSGFDYWEVYDEGKVYSNLVFAHDYEKGEGTLNYRYNLWTIIEWKAKKMYSKKNMKSAKRFVVVEEVITPDELKTLVSYCRCDRCQMWKINPFRRLVCPCCVGCIQAALDDDGHISVHVVRKTRRYRNEKQNSKSLWSSRHFIGPDDI